MLRVEWRAAERQFSLEVDDLEANFSGLAEYHGPERACFVFSDVRFVRLSVDLTAPGLMVYRWKIEKLDGANYKSQISFSPAGEIIIECAQIDFIKDGNLAIGSSQAG